jgi:cytochrome c-type biogenesis protein CcmH/NrfG
MEERLESFIRGNKRDFDQCEPPVGLWEKIEQELDEKRKKESKKTKVVRLSFLLKMVASLAVIVAAGLFLGQYQYNQATDLANIDPAHYTSVIETKVDELKQIEEQEPQLYQEFSSEIRKMDESYQRLKNDLPSSPNQEETVKAMIRNLQIQAEVLNQQLNVIKQINDSKKQENDETQSI